MDLITSHLNADFDAMASMVAAKRLYPNALIAFPGSQEKKVRAFMEAFSPLACTKLKDLDMASITRLIIVDAKSPDRLGTLSVLLDNPNVSVHVYDHHEHKGRDIHGALEHISPVGATATLFVELLKDRGLRPTPMEATTLCLGIYEETGCMLYPSTTERDMLAAAHLIKCGASLNIVATYVKSELSAEEIDLLSDLTHSARHIVEGGLRIAIAKSSRKEYVGDAAHLAHRIMDTEPMDAAFIIVSMQGKVLIVGRSRTPELNIAQVMEGFGGGGHPTAASATIEEMPLEVIEERMLQLIKTAIKPGKFALDVMTAPVITINAAATIKDAQGLMTRYGVNVLPVLDSNDKYEGIITREAMEKAAFHGFKKSPAIDFATTDALTCERYDTVKDIERLMIEHNQRFMPVLDGQAIVGAITRTDLLRAMYEDRLRREHLPAPGAEGRTSTQRNLSSQIHSRLPVPVVALLKTAGRIAQGLSYEVYLVGGSVRDLLRGEENLDMDLVVEGDGIVFAHKLGKEMGAKVSEHERFKTAKVISKDFRVDVATARTEYYDSPAALPKVESSSLKKDLYRRDFTINTLAVKLNPGEFGKLVDYFGGQRDLKEGTIRVLHNLSFVEDPTRAFRAVRFAQRFGFRLSKHTERLIKTTLEMRLFDRLSGSRLYDEFQIIFGEREPMQTVRSLDAHGLLGVVHPELSFSERMQGQMASLHDTLMWFDLLYTGEHPDRVRLHFMALVLGLEHEQRKVALDRLGMPTRTRDKFIAQLEQATLSLGLIPFNNPAELYQLLSPLPLEVVLLAMAISPDDRRKREVSHYLMQLRHVKPHLDGNDLRAMGVPRGPVYSKLLHELLMGTLRETLKTREDEIRHVEGKMREGA